MGMDLLALRTTSRSRFDTKRLKNFSHQILLGLTRATPIWGFPAVISGDGYPFINQRTKQVPTIMLDLVGDTDDNDTIRTIGIILSESVRALDQDSQFFQRVQMLTLNNGNGRYSIIVQALDSRDLGELPYFLHIHRYHILKTVFAIIDALGGQTDASTIALH